jgi:hypothetical protein
MRSREAFLHRQVQAGIDPTGQAAGQGRAGQGRHERANERTGGQTEQEGIMIVMAMNGQAPPHPPRPPKAQVSTRSVVAAPSASAQVIKDPGLRQSALQARDD